MAGNSGAKALYKKMDSNSKYEKPIRDSLLDFSNQYNNCEKIFKKPEGVLEEHLDFHSYKVFSDCPIIDKNYLIKFVRTLCLRKTLDRRSYKNELQNLQNQISKGGLQFNETFYLEHTNKNVEGLQYIFKEINKLCDSAQILYENTIHLITSFALLICKNEEAEEDAKNCLFGLYACHSAFICRGKSLNFFMDTMSSMFNGKLEATYVLVEKLSTQPILETTNNEEKSLKALATQATYELQKKGDIFSYYKLIYQLHLVVDNKKYNDEAEEISQEEFNKLAKLLPVDFSDLYLIDELFTNVKASTYYSYRHLFLKY